MSPPADRFPSQDADPTHPSQANDGILRSASRNSYADVIVVAAFAILGMGSGVFLSIRNSAPPIVISFLLATGIAALTYKFLGGIEGASFKVGALKLTGSLAALVGIAMIINSQLVHQIEPARVWYLDGTVVDKSRKPVDKLNDADFTVFPALARAEKLGGFRVKFIRDMTAGALSTFLTVKHDGFGPVTVPLDLDQLKKLYPDAEIKDNTIKIDHIILPRQPNFEVSSSAKRAQVQPLQQEQLAVYGAAAEAAQPANPTTGGVPK